LTSGFAVARELTFEQRVAAQEAIERVYYSHQIGTSAPFEEAVPRAVIEKKVRTYLKQSVAVETFWNNPVTSDLLHQELERMAVQTRMPDRLLQLFKALGNDPLLIQESLARPALVDRLARNFFAYDATIHTKTRYEAEAFHEDLVQGRLDPWSDHPGRTVAEYLRVDVVEAGARYDQGERPIAGSQGGTARIQLKRDEFDRYFASLPARVGEIGQLHEEREAFVTRVVLSKTREEIKVATVTVPKLSWDEWWHSAEGRLEEASVKALAPADDSLPVVRSEISPDALCLADDTWTPTLHVNMPSPRAGHTAVWTGNLMVVWGGYNGAYLNTGGRYDPALDIWSPTSTAAPSPRTGHTAVWTGSRMIVWGGNEIPHLKTGGRYDPISNTWSATSSINAPSARVSHTAVWTGSLMVVWGGYDALSYFQTGGRYNPVSDIWTPTSTTNAPTARGWHVSKWTGNLMVVWGGSPFTLNTGGRYDPVNDTWTPTSTTNAPAARVSQTAIWTGTLMVVWGGSSAEGGRYDPAMDTWTPTSTTNAPSARVQNTAVWTGSVMIIWGGITDANTGGRYDPGNDTWTSTSQTNAPSYRYYHTAVWTGSLMVVWGGFDGAVRIDTGASYALGHSQDDDGDGFSECQGDCNDANAMLWFSPVVVTNLVAFGQGPTQLSWDSEGGLVGPETSYDLVSGTFNAVLNLASGTCLQVAGGTTYIDTRTNPSLGSAYWYLARASNDCGVGSYGRSQRDNAIPSCP
jgi:hypothetical protein